MRNGFRKTANWRGWRLCSVIGLLVLAPSLKAQSSGCTIDVALLGAEVDPGRLDEMAAALGKDERIASVATIQIDAVTPSVEDLLKYDAVMVWTNDPVADNIKLGDNLADYVDLGGGVVVGMWTFAAPDQPHSIGGRFFTENYYCITRLPNTIVRSAATLGVVHYPTHPIMAGVATFDGGNSAVRSNAPLTVNATRIADWNTGEILVATREDLLGKRVDLGLWPVSSASFSNGWIEGTDGWILMANALHWVSPCSGANGYTLCDGAIASSATPDPDIGDIKVRASNDTTMDYDVAIPFSSGTGGEITNVTLWGVYEDNEPPPTQGFHVDFWRLNGDDAPVHEMVHTAFASTVPIETGFNQTASGSPLPIFEFQLALNPPFQTVANEPLRMSVSLNGGPNDLRWQLARTDGSHFRIHDSGAVKTTAGTPAFAICRPAGASGCFGFGSTFDPHSRSNVFRGLGFSFLFDEFLTEISTELTLAGPTVLHWLVFESESRDGLYTLIHESTTTPASGGMALYSSGKIEVPVFKDRFYIVGRAWGSESVTYYTNRAPIPHPWPMGTMEFSYGINDFELTPIQPIQFDKSKLDLLSEHNISVCFGEETLCVCDMFDTSTGRGVCDLFDLLAFQTAFGLGDPSACDFDTSTGSGICDMFDFIAFQSVYAEGCP